MCIFIVYVRGQIFVLGVFLSVQCDMSCVAREGRGVPRPCEERVPFVGRTNCWGNKAEGPHRLMALHSAVCSVASSLSAPRGFVKFICRDVLELLTCG